MISKLVYVFLLSLASLSVSANHQLFYEFEGYQPSEQTSVADDDRSVIASWHGWIMEAALTRPDEATLLTLSNGEVFVLERHSLEPQADGALIWSGKVYDAIGQEGHASFILQEEGVRGHVSISHTFLEISAIGRGLHLIQQVSQEHSDRDGDPVVRGAGNGTGGQKKQVRENEGGTGDSSREAAGGSGEPARTALGTPTLTVRPDFCYDSVFAFWTSVPGADYYKVSVVGGSNIYKGPAESAWLLFGCCQSRYLVVRACNSTGCGEPSAPAFAQYFNICY